MTDTATPSPAAHLLRAAGEGVLLALCTLPVWPFASVEPFWEALAAAGVVLLAALWAAHAAASKSFQFAPDVVSLSLGGIALGAVVQLVPLPLPVVAVIAPARAEWHRTLLPDPAEQLPGEAAPVPRPGWLPLTICPAATRTFLAQVLGGLVVYAAARNWLATRAAFTRLAWAGAAAGAGVAGLAFAQATSSPRDLVYWSVPVDGPAFGPFACKNHYPDYAFLCLGLTFGLLLRRPPAGPDEWRPAAAGGFVDAVLAAVRAVTDPRAVGLLAAAGLVMASVPFSLSRGGVLAGAAAAAGAWALTRFGRGRTAGAGGGPGRALVSAAAGVGVLSAAWFGWAPVESRLGTLATGEAATSRLPLWRDAARLIPAAWAAGTGGGTFQWAEPTVRTTAAPVTLNDSAHNEYLEALVEGGVARFGFTLLLAGGVLVAVGRGYRRAAHTPAEPLLLGAWFGLAALAGHSVGDFGVHLPAVALLAAGVAGHAMAAAADAGPQHRRVRVRVRAGAAPGPPGDNPGGPAPGVPGGWRLRGPAAVGAGTMVLLAAVAAAADGYTRAEADGWRAAAVADPGRRAEFLAGRAVCRPDDPDAQVELAEARFAAAPPGDEAALAPGLAAARAARAACPLNPKPHELLGRYAGGFVRGEPGTAHLARAKRLLSVDPDIWYRAGRAAYDRGDNAAAWADWRESLARSARFVGPIVTAAAQRLSPAGVRDAVVPDDPARLVEAADALFPDPADRGGAGRRPFLEKAVGLAADTAGGAGGAALAADELGDRDRAAGLWRRAAELAGDDDAAADVAARGLERDERYADAVPVLDGLVRRRPDVAALRDRLAAARHGADLARVLAGGPRGP